MLFRTAACGVMLVIIGCMAYFGSETENPSPTALIPAFFGAALLLCAGLVAMKESLRKHVMHVAAMVGALGFFGGFAPIIRTLAKGGEIDITKDSIRNGLMMTAICLVFVMLCVQSFIEARKARQAKALEIQE